MATNNKSAKYTEPTEFFPKELRKKYSLGEYNKKSGSSKGTSVKPKAKTTKK